MKETKAEKAIRTLEKVFNEQQLSVIKSTILHGAWGNTEVENNKGKSMGAYGYMTSYVKVGLKDLSNRQIAGIYSGISKVIKKTDDLDFIVHISDYWGEGKSSDGMLLIDYSISREIEEWSKPIVKAPLATVTSRKVGDIHKNGLWTWKEYKPGKFDWRVVIKVK